MSHDHQKIREKIRVKANEFGGILIFELPNHDLFEFKLDTDLEGFAAWSKEQKHVKKVILQKLKKL